MSNSTSSAKHTAGPWDYSDPHDACCGWACTPNGCHESHPTGIYVIHGPEECDTEICGMYGLALKNEADARLISAAPDLLEALQRLVDTDAWLDAAPEEQVEAEGNARLDAAIVAARAALTKAQGGAS